MNDFDRFKAHLKRHQDEYLLLGSGIGIGIGLMLLRGKPKINEAQIVDKWLTQAAKGGYHIYGLTNDQKALWEATWGWAVRESVDSKLAMPKVIKILTDELSKVSPLAKA